MLKDIRLRMEKHSNKNKERLRPLEVAKKNLRIGSTLIFVGKKYSSWNLT